VVRLPSLAIGLGLGRPRPAEPEAPLDLALVAAPRPSAAAVGRYPSAAAIPLERPELEELGSAYSSGRVEILIDERATVDGVRALAGRAKVLQFVVHGVWDDDRERAAGLVLAPSHGGQSESGGSPDNGILWGEEVEDLAVPPIVVLAACRGGLGPRRAGDVGLLGLGVDFFRAGAESVVLSEDEVALAPTMELMAHVHRGLAGGASIAVALRDARRALAGTERWSDPFYHSIVYVLGLDRRLPGAEHAHERAR
jgi:CHAT domain-containing protein